MGECAFKEGLTEAITLFACIVIDLAMMPAFDAKRRGDNHWLPHPRGERSRVVLCSASAFPGE